MIIEQHVLKCQQKQYIFFWKDENVAKLAKNFVASCKRSNRILLKNILNLTKNFQFITTISTERIAMFSWNFDKVDKISLETLWHSQVESLKYLRMRKLQLLSATYNLLTKFLMEKTRRFHFFSFMTNMKLKMTLGIPLTNEIDWWGHQLGY